MPGTAYTNLFTKNKRGSQVAASFILFGKLILLND